MTSKELVKKEETSLAAVAPVDLEEYGIDITDLEFDRIKIPAGGIKQLQVVSDGEDEMVKELTGVIVYAHPAYARWPEKEAAPGEQVMPLCSSFDGKTGTDEDGAKHICSSCPHYQWGSGKNGGKDCKTGYRLYVLQDGEMLPMLFNVPPTSSKVVKAYIGKGLMKGLPSFGYETTFTVGVKQAKSGDNYGVLILKRGAVLDNEKMQEMSQMAESIKAASRRVAIFDDEDDTPPTIYEGLEVEEMTIEDN
jgi:hypothetical protein